MSFRVTTFIFLYVFIFNACKSDDSLEHMAIEEIKILEALMAEAQEQSKDVTREETLLWFSKEFLKFANWDEANKSSVEKLFGYYGPYEKNKTQYAEQLPDLERQKVIEMVHKGIDNLQKVLDGSITRRPAVKIDWQNIEVSKDMLLSNGKPVFLFDYFSKSVGRPLIDKKVYNDHLGNIYHGGSKLYEVNEDRPINPFLLNKDLSFDQERLSLLDDIPNTNVGFLLYWNMGMPQWIHDQESEVAKGRSLFTGFDIDNPLMREVWGTIARKTGELTKGKKVTQLGYIFSNEPHWYSEKGHWTQKYKEMNSISSYTLNHFRKWLSKQYDNKIETLNKNWKSSFTNFNDLAIDIPIDPVTRGEPKWYDWCRFNMDRGINWFSFLQSELHSANPDADTHIKIMPRAFTDDNRSHGIDLEALTELTTMIGDDAKITGGRGLRKTEPEKWEAKYAYHWDELAVSYDFMESVSPKKIHINSEVHFLSTSQWKDLNTSTDYTRSSFWLATIHGMDVGISWFWARDPDGSPEDRLEGELDFFDPALAGSYAGSANMQPQTVNELAQVYMDMNSYSEEIMALRHQRRPVRLFHSETAAINKEHHISQQYELYESLYFEGFPLGYATEKIINKQDPNNWDLVLVYKTEYVTDKEFDALQNYLNKGGTILIDRKYSLSKNEYGYKRPRRLEEGKGRLIIMDDEVSISKINEKTLELISNNLHEVELKESNGTAYKGCTWRVVKNSEGGYLMTIINLGKNTANIQTNLRNGKKLSCTNMLTGELLGAEFQLQSKKVLLLELNAI